MDAGTLEFCCNVFACIVRQATILRQYQFQNDADVVYALVRYVPDIMAKKYSSDFLDMFPVTLGVFYAASTFVNVLGLEAKETKARVATAVSERLASPSLHQNLSWDSAGKAKALQRAVEAERARIERASLAASRMTEVWLDAFNALVDLDASFEEEAARYLVHRGYDDVSRRFRSWRSYSRRHFWISVCVENYSA